MAVADYNAVQASYFSFELDGIELGYFTACSGLSTELEVITQKAINTEGKNIEVKQPGRQNFTEVVLKRGYTKDTALNDWFDETVDAGAAVVRKTGSVVLLSRDLAEVCRFNLDNCFPSKLSISDLSAGASEAMVEELTIRHELLTMA